LGELPGKSGVPLAGFSLPSDHVRMFSERLPESRMACQWSTPSAKLPQFRTMPPPAVTEPKTTVPLCIDLDGTLIKTDLLWESLLRLLRHNPLYAFAALWWWRRGRAHLKARIAARVQIDPASLPYNRSLLELIEAEKRQGRRILLVTASDAQLARLVANHLGIFDELLASDGHTNLRGKNKGAKLAERFGVHGFDYAGNSSADLPVWEQAREAIVVGAGPRLIDRARQRARINQVIPNPNSKGAALLKSLRPHQWVKNLIVFVPLLTSHKITEWPLPLDALIGFIAFCCCASATYVLNDLFDLAADRHHPTKRLRPFAAGDLPLPIGLVAFPVLLAAGALLGLQLGLGFLAVLAIYCTLTTSYSWWLKKIALLDVFCLAGLYTLRLIAGHEATGIVFSFWLLVFSMFIFLSLALVKRYLELENARQQGKAIPGRGYAAGDAPVVATLGASSGFLAVLVLALYVNSPEVRLLYRTPTWLLLICPLLLYWISRVWLMAHRGQMHEDPIVFALKDKVSYLIGLVTLLVLWLATSGLP
jgi:4-hydroxybenzoate polyprenyltransferase/phosphoserine phosphatase